MFDTMFDTAYRHMDNGTYLLARVYY